MALRRSLLRVSAVPRSMSSTAATSASVAAGPSSSVAPSTSVNLRWRHHAAALLGKRAGARLALRLGVRAKSMANLAAKAPMATSEAKWAYGQELLDYYSKCYLPAMRAQIAALVDLQRQTALRSTTEQLARDILPPGLSARAAARAPMMILVPLTTGLSPINIDARSAAPTEAEAAAADVTASASGASSVASADTVEVAAAVVSDEKPQKKKNNNNKKKPGKPARAITSSALPSSLPSPALASKSSATGVPPLTQEQLDAATEVSLFMSVLVPTIKACRTPLFRHGLLGNKEVFMKDHAVSAQGVLDYLRPLCVAGEWRAACDVFWRGHQLGKLVPASYLLCIYAASMDGNEKLAMTACVRALCALRADGRAGGRACLRVRVRVCGCTSVSAPGGVTRSLTHPPTHQLTHSPARSLAHKGTLLRVDSICSPRH
jgi:hypothetical protein